MKKLKWIIPLLIVVSLVTGVIGCKDPEVEHQHQFTKKWEIDEYYHWKKCNCGEIDFESEHSFGDWQVIKAATEEAEGKQERKCTVCPYTTTEVIEKLAHTHKFATDWTITKAATEEAEGSKERSCTVCGYTATEVIEKLAHTHKFATDWTQDGTYHWHAAICEHTTEVSEKAAHSFGDWTITKAATEEAEGSRERSCTVCGYTATEVIEKLAHIHKFATDWTKDSTCHWYATTCTCGLITEVSEIAEHSFGNWTTTKESTEEAEGSKERTCTVCGYTATEAIEKLAHTHKFAESLTKDETHHWYAAICEHTTEVSGKAKHSFGDWTVTKAATKEAEGSKERVCTVCNYKEVVDIAKIPEDFVFVKGGTVTGAAYTNNYEGVFIEGRTVTLSDFYMGKYEVTQEEYASVMEGQKVTVNGTDYTLESNPSYCTADSTSYTLFNGDVQEKRPVEEVTWYDSVWYCNALSEKEGLTKVYNIEVTEVKQAWGKNYIFSANVTLNKNANGYRLPTEAEWEFAARGGDPTKEDWNYVFSGADTAEGVSYDSKKNSGLDSVGWYSYNSINGTTGDTSPSSGEQGCGTHQVGKKAPNILGLYDMSGNVFEWCYDWYGTVDNETPVDGAASGSYRVFRGGSWRSVAYDASVSYRCNCYPNDRDCFLGFRVVRPSSK